MGGVVAAAPGDSSTGGPQQQVKPAPAFRDVIKEIPHEGTWEESAAHLKALIRSRALLFTDMRDRPDKFFEAHRLLADRMLGGFGVRFTVQFNLFAGSILTLGSKAQVGRLLDFQDEGTLGCFALTEDTAGVNSGLVVETTATWNPAKRNFVLNTPNDGARKKWISQGLAAEMAVVIATVVVDGVGKGPHAFLMKLRDEHGRLVPGVETEDMGRKTTANELDNAFLRFTEVAVDESALLDRFAGFDEMGVYEVRGGISRMGIEVIGQRLLTGRLVIAEAQIQYVLGVLHNTRKYAENRRVWSPMPGTDARLSGVPHIADLFDRCERELTFQRDFCSAVEKQLWRYLQSDELVPNEIAEAISVAKVRGVEAAIRCFQELQNEVGSHALMAGQNASGFLWSDILQCAKFAEGDSRVLMQKMARDRLKEFQKGGLRTMAGRFSLDPQQRAEATLCLTIGRALKAAQRHGPGAVMEAWNGCWREVYALANMVCDRHQHAEKGQAPYEALQQRPAAEPHHVRRSYPALRYSLLLGCGCWAAVATITKEVKALRKI